MHLMFERLILFMVYFVFVDIMQEKHYTQILDQCKNPKPNRKNISQHLDLEFHNRRDYIEDIKANEAEKIKMVSAKYQCFTAE